MKKQILLFTKPPLSTSDQILKLQNRGLIINDLIQCSTALTYIGYYRLSGYMIPYYEYPRQNHRFKIGANFEKIINDYEFDRQLRLICLRAIEQIEVAFRTVVSDCMSLCDNNSHWYEKKDYFKDKKYHTDLLFRLNKTIGKPSIKPLNKTKEKFIDHYHRKYSQPELPPSWMIFETLSFGEISFLYKNLQARYKKQIAKTFDLDDKILSSWIHSLCFLRNLCAHHSRIWNREMSIPPKIAKIHKAIQTSGKHNYLFGQLIIIKIIFDKIDPTNKWSLALLELLSKFPNINTNQMGFQDDWKKVFKFRPLS